MTLRWVSLLGVLTMIALAWACSLDRRRFPWRVVLWGVALQFVFALFILKTSLGRDVFDLAQAVVLRLTGFALEGAAFVLGPLADAELLRDKLGPKNVPILAVLVSATIILISALSSLLYHWGILQRVVQAIAWVMQRALRTSGSETLATAANIFIGQTEAPLLVKPYLAGMTRSELMALMTGGMATIAGGVLAAYAEFGRQAGFPDMAGHLVAASVMSAPAALMMAKIMLPETQTSQTAAGVALQLERTSTNSIDALCRGAADGLQLAFNVFAMLLAFVAVVALVNHLVALLGHLVGVELSLQAMLGWLNAPFAWVMGLPLKDCPVVGAVLGERIVLNEFVGYVHLTAQIETLEPRSFILATYALCGFANFGSIAIQIGGIGALVPQRREDLARLGFRAMLAGLLACYLTAAMVGILLE